MLRNTDVPICSNSSTKNTQSAMEQGDHDSTDGLSTPAHGHVLVAGMGPRAGLDERGMAQLLMRELWLQQHVDPSWIMCLVIPANNLLRDVEWGKALWDAVTGIIGTTQQQAVAKVVAQVRQVFAKQQAVGLSPQLLQDGAGGTFGRVARAFRKTECVDTLLSMMQSTTATRATLRIPCMVQFVKPGPSRSFRAYEYPQSMVQQAVHTMGQENSEYLCLYETPISKSGVSRLYMDYEIYLHRMQFITGDTLAEKIAALERVADDIVRVWSMILVKLQVVNKSVSRVRPPKLPTASTTKCSPILKGCCCPLGLQDIVKFVVKDNSRQLENGDYGVKRHIVSDILLTRHAFERVQQLTFDWIQTNCPAAHAKIFDQKAAVTAQDSSRMVDNKTRESLVSLVGIDPACKSSLQMIRMVWTKKDAKCTTISSLQSGVSACDGQIVQPYKPVVPAAYTGGSKLQRLPPLEPPLLAAAMWDSLVTVPSPFCRGCNPIDTGKPAPLCARTSGHTDTARPANKKTRYASDAGWDAIQCAWFKRFCRASCGGRLPCINTNVRYATPPEGEWFPANHE